MAKSDFKRQTSKEYARDKLSNRKWICTSPEWIKWAKKYLNRYYRHKENGRNREDVN